MDQILEKLREHGKNDQETVLQWMKDANIIADKRQEDKAKQYLKESSSSNQVDGNQLKYVIEELAKERRQSVEELHLKLSTHSAKLMASVKASLESLAKAAESTLKMDEAFEKLKQQGKNDQATLINWMKEAQILADQRQEEEAKKYFKATAEDKVDMERFKAVLEKVAKDKKLPVADLHTKLLAKSAKLMETLKAKFSKTKPKAK